MRAWISVPRPPGASRNSSLLLLRTFDPSTDSQARTSPSRSSVTTVS
jgi:hypothetical protein